jgi:hypothetical protein
MKDEFKYLYASLFRNPQNYITVVNALGKKKIGLTRNEISEVTKLPNSGFLTKILDELISCGFIRKYTMFGKKTKDAIYQLTDQYSLFYFQFLQKKSTDEHFWTIQLDTSTRNAWCGNAFERVCLDHVSEIKAKLGISGVLTETHSWISKPDAIKKTKGAQIDLVLARKDRIINLCEMKYSFGKYTFTKKDADSLLNKIAAIKNASETKCSIHPVLVTPYGLTEGVNTGLIQAVIKAEDLFVKMV